MKKKTISGIVIVAVLLLSFTVSGVQAFAVSALSVFRVGETKTINITPDDISQMVIIAKGYADANPGHREDVYEKPQSDKPDYNMLIDVSEFTAFNVTLPNELKNQKPELFATDIIEKNIPIQNDESVLVALSPTFIAKYENMTFIATQGMNNSVSSEEKNEIRQKILSSPMLTENIRTQLAVIDPNTKDIYLPVITGISREADLGGTTGYLYSASDIQAIMGALPAELTTEMQNEMVEKDSEDQNSKAIIWTKNGVLYALTGDLSDNELIAVARSVR